MFVTTADPEAFQMDWEEAILLTKEIAQERADKIAAIQKAIFNKEDPVHVFQSYSVEELCHYRDELGLEAEHLVIDLANKAYVAESHGNHKFARIARVFVPALRGIYWHGQLKEEAKFILGDMELEQTQPLASLDTQYGNSDGVYMEVDSYTGVPMVETRQEEAEMLGDRKAPVIPDMSDGLILRIVEECRELGYTEDQTTEALNASMSRFEEAWEDEPYEDRGITSVPITQSQEEEMRLDLEAIAEIREKVGGYLAGIKRAAIWAKVNGEVKLFLKGKDLEAHIFNKARYSRAASNLLSWAASHAKDYNPQDLYAILVSAVYLDDRLDEVPIPGYISMKSFADQWGDAILDDMADATTHPIPTSESEIVRQAETWEKEIVETFSDDPEAPIIQQKAYAEGIFNALASGEPDLNEAGYRNWRMKKSLPGAIAYNIILKTEIANKTDWKEAVKKAWRGFWNAGKIITVKRDGVVVKSIANGKEQFCQWPLARWKLAHYEIFLTKADRERLNGILAERHWSGLAL